MMQAMGLFSWIAAGVVVAVVLRLVRAGWRGAAWVELVVAIVAAFAAGVGATALDFGGWSELDWRAIAFCSLVAAAAIGAIRAIRK